MTLEEKKKTELWFKSQLAFHRRREGKWHASQVRWFQRQLKVLYTFAEIVNITFLKYAPQIAASVQSHNSLLRILRNAR